MTTPGGVPNLPVGALTLDNLAEMVQDMSGDAMKNRAVERMPGVFSQSTGLSPLLEFTPFGLLTRIYAEVQSVIANADPADINGPEDLPELVTDFILGLPFVSQFVGVLEAILGTYDGEDETLLLVEQFFAPVRALMQLFAGIGEGIPNVEEITAGVQQFLQAFEGLDLTNPGAIAAFVQSGIQTLVSGLIQLIIDTVINGLTGSNHSGHPAELLSDVLGGVGRGVETAIESANQATNHARELMQYVVQTIQSSPVAVVFGDIAEGVNAFAFWFLGMFGMTQQAVSEQNPIFGKLEGRVAVLEANAETGTSGWNDHFNRPDIGPDWVTISPRGALQIQDSKRLKSYAARSGRYAGAIQLTTDTWHVQAAVAAMDYGNSRIYVATNGDATDASFTKGICLDFSHQSYGFRLTMYTMAGGLLSGMTERDAREWDVGVVKNGDVFAIERIPDEPTNPATKYTFYLYLNNAELTEMRWPDTGGVVLAGPAYRGVAILTNTVNNASFSGPGFDDLSAYDIKVS